MSMAPELIADALFKIVYPNSESIFDSLQCVALSGGRNNRSYRITHGDRVVVLKHYFTSARDFRDRRGTEAVFLKHCKACGISVVPELITTSEDLHASLMSYQDGQPFTAESTIEEQHVEAALRFFNDLQQLGYSDEIKDASEAHWGLSGHLQRAELRLKRLQSATVFTNLDQDMRRFTDGPLRAEWDSIRRKALQSSNDLLNDARYFERLISPSDFGFHNALQSRDGSTVFSSSIRVTRNNHFLDFCRNYVM